MANLNKESAEFINKHKFSKMVDDLVQRESLDYMDAVVFVCEQTGIEVETCKKYLSDSIRNKLEQQAKRLNLIEKDTFQPLE